MTPTYAEYEPHLLGIEATARSIRKHVRDGLGAGSGDVEMILDDVDRLTDALKFLIGELDKRMVREEWREGVRVEREVAKLLSRP